MPVLLGLRGINFQFVPAAAFLVCLSREFHSHQLAQRHFRSGIDFAASHQVATDHVALAGRNRKMNVLAPFFHGSRN